jgi:hypothetical protein
MTDLIYLWYTYFEVPINALIIAISIAAVIYWVRVFRGITISGEGDKGWLWIFAAVLTTLLLNVATLFLTVSNGRVPIGLGQFIIVDVDTLSIVTTLSRGVMAALLTHGAYMLFGSMKGMEGRKFAFTSIEPKAETPSVSKPKYELLRGIGYIVKEGAPTGDVRGYYMRADRRTVTGIELFTDVVTHGRLGICVTRKFPGKVRQDYGLMMTPMVWLTQDKGASDSMPPSDLPWLSHMIKEFIAKSGDCIVLLDGIEYLAMHNSFADVIRVIEGLNDVVSQNKTTLIVTVDPSALTEQQFHLLSRELTEFLPTSDEKA